jgi:hypothetical protein
VVSEGDAPQGSAVVRVVVGVVDDEGLGQQGMQESEQLALVTLAPPSSLGAPSPRIHRGGR